MTLCQLRIRKLISDKNSTLMDITRKNFQTLPF